MQTGTRRSGWQSTPCGVPPRKAFMCVRRIRILCWLHIVSISFYFILDNLAVVFGMRERERECKSPKTQQQSQPFVRPVMICVFMLWNELAQRCSQPTFTTIAAKQLGKCKTWTIATLPKQAISQFHDRVPCAVHFDLCLWPRSTIVLPRFAPFIRFGTVVPNRDQAARGDNSCQCSRTQRTFLEDLAGIHHLTTPHNSSHN